MTPAPALHSPRMALVDVRGAEAARFLHAQLTSDVEALEPGRISLGAWCNPRGRVRNLFWILRRGTGEDFALIAPEDEADGLERGLRRFVLRSKVAVRRDDVPVFGAAGTEANAFVTDWIGAIPAAGFVVETADRLATHLPVGPSRFLVQGRGFAPRLPDDASAAWRRLEIAAEIAWLDDTSRDAFIPQMLNLDRLGAVSFEKGCYPGQEVIARARYLGQVKRRLYRARIAAGSRPEPGRRILADTRIAGTIVASEETGPNDGHEILAVLRIGLAGARLEVEDDGRGVAIIAAD